MHGFNAILRAGVAAAALTLTPFAAEAQQRNIVETASNAGSFSTLLQAAQAAGLADALASGNELTVLAPTDEAFAKLGDHTLRDLLRPRNHETLRRILSYHVIEGRLDASGLAGARTATTLSGQRVNLAFDGGLRVDGANVVAPNVAASNGVIHVIDAVLMPEQDRIPKVAEKAGSFSTLLAAARAAGLAEARNGDGPLTVFAPTDEAFAALGSSNIQDLLRPENRDRLVAILSYHVIEGRVYASDVIGGVEAQTLQGSTIRAGLENGAVRVNDARVVAADVEAANGVIHVIDSVLLPSGSAETADGVVGDAARLLSLAVERGAPLFNDGSPEACAAVYEIALTAIRDGEGLPADVQRLARQGLSRGSDTNDAEERAWRYRDAIDAIYGRLETMARSQQMRSNARSH